MPLQRCEERFALDVGKVDREAGTIAGVLVCGNVSSNGRDYPNAVFARDYAKYEGRPVNCDHGRDATVDRRLGWFTDVRPAADGRPRGTLHCLKSHPMYERVMEAAERNPKLFGFSHVAMCRTRYEGGREVVESIDSVESIDLVAEPATTQGLFEGRAKEPRTVPMTIKEVLDRLVRHPRTESRQVKPLKWLAEMEGMDGAPASMAPPAEDADPAEGIKQAFLDAALAEMSACMDAKGDPARLKKCLGKLKRMLNAHAEISADEEVAEPGAGYDGDDEDEETKESKPTGANANAYREAKQLCEAAGFGDATDLDITTVMSTPDAERRRVVENLRRAAHPPERPTSAGLGRLGEGVRATPRAAKKTEAAEDKPVTDPKAFARLVEASNN